MFRVIKMTEEEFNKLKQEFDLTSEEFKREMNRIQDGIGSETRKEELGRKILELSDQIVRARI